MSDTGSSHRLSQLEQARVQTAIEYGVSRRVQNYMNDVVEISSIAAGESFNSPDLLNMGAQRLEQTIGYLANEYSIYDFSGFLLSVTGRHMKIPDVDVSSHGVRGNIVQIAISGHEEDSSGEAIVECRGRFKKFRVDSKLEGGEYQLVPKLVIVRQGVPNGFLIKDNGNVFLDSDFAVYAEATIDNTSSIEVVNAKTTHAYLEALAETERYRLKYPWFSDSVDRLDAGMKCKADPDATGRVLSELGRVIDNRAPSPSDFENGLDILSTILSGNTLAVTGDVPTEGGGVRRLTALGKVANLSGTFGESGSKLVLHVEIDDGDSNRKQMDYHFPLSGIRRVMRLG